MRINLDNQYYSGTAGFVDNGNTAIISYKGTNNVPKGTMYNIDGRVWRVVNILPSQYIKGVINIHLIEVK